MCVSVYLAGCLFVCVHHFLDLYKPWRILMEVGNMFVYSLNS